MMRISRIVMTVLLTTGCQANQDSLSDFMAALSSSPDVSALHKTAAVTAAQRDVIQYHHRRSPFVRAQDTQPVVMATNSASAKCQPTAAVRKAGQFSTSPLAEIKVKGIIGTEQYRVALVINGAGEYQQIQQGAYLSRAYVRVVRISADKLHIEPLSAASESSACGALAERYLQLQ